MAETKVLSVTLRTYRKQIEELKGSLLQLKDAGKEGSEEWAKTIDEVAKKEKTLKDVTESLAKADANYNENSLAALRKRLAAMKKVANETMDVESAAYKNASQEILALNNQIKYLENQQGTFSRNVGDYTNSMLSAFNKLGINVQSVSPLMSGLADSFGKASAEGVSGFAVLSNGVKGFGKSMGALTKANPFGAILVGIQLVVNLFMKLKQRTEENEEANLKLQSVLAPFRGLMDGITNAVNQFVDGLINVIGFIGKATNAVLDFLHIGNEMRATQAESAKLMAEVTKEERTNLEETKKYEAQISDLRERVSDSEEYSIKQRIEFSKQAQEIEEKRFQKQMAVETKRLKAMELAAKNTKNSTEIEKKLSEQRAKLDEITKQHTDTLKTFNKEQKRLNREEQAEIKATAKAAADAYKQRLEQIKQLKNEYASLVKTIADYGKDDLTKALDDNEQKYQDDLVLLRKYLKEKIISQSEYEQRVAQLGNIKIANDNAIIKNWEKQAKSVADTLNDMFLSENESKIQSIIRKYEKEMVDMQENLAKGFITNEQFDEYVRKSREAQEQAIKEMVAEINKNEIQKAFEEQLKLPNEWENGLRDRVLNAFKAGTIDENVARDLLAKLFPTEEIDAIFKQINDDMRTALLVDTMDMLEQFTSEITSIGDGISSEWGNVFRTIGDGIANVSAEMKKGGKGYQLYAQMAVAAFNVVGSTMNALADEQDTNTEEGFKKAKKYQIAAATMSMLSGILNATTSAFSNENAWMTIWGQIALAASTSAMVAGLGGAQIAAIKRQTLDSGNQSSAASVPSITLPTLPMLNENEDINNMRDMNSADRIAESLNSQRVYIVESDIQESGRKTQVREQNSTF